MTLTPVTSELFNVAVQNLPLVAVTLCKIVKLMMTMFGKVWNVSCFLEKITIQLFMYFTFDYSCDTCIGDLFNGVVFSLLVVC